MKTTEVLRSIRYVDNGVTSNHKVEIKSAAYSRFLWFILTTLVDGKITVIGEERLTSTTVELDVEMPIDLFIAESDSDYKASLDINTVMGMLLSEMGREARTLSKKENIGIVSASNKIVTKIAEQCNVPNILSSFYTKPGRRPFGKNADSDKCEKCGSKKLTRSGQSPKGKIIYKCSECNKKFVSNDDF